MEQYVFQIFMGLLLLLIGFLQGMIIKQGNDREARFDEKVKNLLESRETAFRNMEKVIADFCERDRKEHDDIWERLNYHRHNGEGRVVIGGKI